MRVERAEKGGIRRRKPKKAGCFSNWPAGKFERERGAEGGGSLIIRASFHQLSRWKRRWKGGVNFFRKARWLLLLLQLQVYSWREAATSYYYFYSTTDPSRRFEQIKLINVGFFTCFHVMMIFLCLVGFVKFVGVGHEKRPLDSCLQSENSVLYNVSMIRPNLFFVKKKGLVRFFRGTWKLLVLLGFLIRYFENLLESLLYWNLTSVMSFKKSSLSSKTRTRAHNITDVRCLTEKTNRVQ